MSIIKSLFGTLIAATLVACGGGGGNASTPSSTPVTSGTTASIASILLTAPSPLSIDASGSSSLEITVSALDASNALIPGAVINVATNGFSILSKSSVTTDSSSGQATVTLRADTSSQSTRVATVTASCSGCSASAATLPVQINGASLALSSSSGSTLTAGGNALTLSALVTDARGQTVPGATVTFATTDATVLNLGPTIYNNGVATANVSGLRAGTASVTATALGNAKKLDFTVNPAAGGVLAISSPATGATIVTGIAQTITVTAPGATSVRFASTLGNFSSQLVNGSSPFTSTLTAQESGDATVEAIDNQGNKASIVLKVSPSSCLANKIIFSASQTTVAQATSTSTPSIRLTARALYSTGGLSDQGVANVPVLFTMSGGPGGGAYLTPAYQVTDGSGYAYADFYSGTSTSNPNGIRIDATIPQDATCSPVRTTAATGTAPSSNPALLTIGGQALSVAFGAASVLRQSTDSTLYIQDYSVQVTDANNNPVADKVVTLRLKPVAFSTGTACAATATYCSEDANDNNSLDANEDGLRTVTTATTTSQCPALPPVDPTKIDGILTPQNSWGGSVPATVTTNSSGIAPFSLTYLKGSAIWIVDKLTATVSVQGTESSGSTIFRLPAIKEDVDPDCHLPASPFQ